LGLFFFFRRWGLPPPRSRPLPLPGNPSLPPKWTHFSPHSLYADSTNSVSVCVLPMMLPLTTATAPNSPTARAFVSTIPYRRPLFFFISFRKRQEREREISEHYEAGGRKGELGKIKRWGGKDPQKKARERNGTISHWAASHSRRRPSRSLPASSRPPPRPGPGPPVFLLSLLKFFSFGDVREESRERKKEGEFFLFSGFFLFPKIVKKKKKNFNSPRPERAPERRREASRTASRAPFRGRRRGSGCRAPC
jgi:hypothetical protein